MFLTLRPASEGPEFGREFASPAFAISPNYASSCRPQAEGKFQAWDARNRAVASRAQHFHDGPLGDAERLGQFRGILAAGLSQVGAPAAAAAHGFGNGADPLAGAHAAI